MVNKLLEKQTQRKLEAFWNFLSFTVVALPYNPHSLQGAYIVSGMFTMFKVEAGQSRM